jgi:hypothetical protein
LYHWLDFQHDFHLDSYARNKNTDTSLRDILVDQAEAKRAKLTAAAQAGTNGNALPSSRTEQLSDAKLFQVLLTKPKTATAP